MEEFTQTDDKSEGNKAEEPLNGHFYENSLPTDNVRILSVDKVTVEKIVLERGKSKEVLLTKSESSKHLPELKKRSPVKTKIVPEKLGNPKIPSKVPTNEAPTHKTRLKLNNNVTSSQEKKVSSLKSSSKLPVSRVENSGGVISLNEKRISPVKLTKSSSIGSLSKANKPTKIASISQVPKIPPKVPAKPKLRKPVSDSNIVSDSKLPQAKGLNSESNLYDCQAGNESKVIKEISYHKSVPEGEDCTTGKEVTKSPGDENHISEVEGDLRRIPCSFESKELIPTENAEPANEDIKSSGTNDILNRSSVAQNRLEKSQSKIEKLQQNLCTKINASTVESYKSELQNLQALKAAPVKNLDLNENITREKFDKEFLEKHNFDKKLKIEEKRVFETDAEYVYDQEKTELKNDIPEKSDKPKYGKKVSEIEKRWSGEFLEIQYEQNSSESSKSSYVEEQGSISSHESIVEDNSTRFIEEIRKRSGEKSEDIKQDIKQQSEELIEDTVSTFDSDSCVEDRIKAIDEDVDEAVKREKVEERNQDNESKDSTLKESSVCTSKTEGTSTLKGGETLKLSSVESDHIEENILDGLTENKSIKETELTLRKSFTKINEVKDDTKIIGENPLLVAKERLKNIKNNNSSQKDIKLETDNNKLQQTETEHDKSAEYEEVKNSKTEEIVIIEDIRNIPETALSKDGYADFIKEYTMEAGTSKPPKEEKKRRGFRRLLPGLFSPKDSRKDYKKEQKERKKREEKHFSQHQQNGNYTRSPDTMNLNEDIKRNVKLDTSLNSSIIEERLNEIKQELFPEQGITTSTPDYFLQGDRSLLQDSRIQRLYTANSSLSSIAPEDKWIDQNIISGSPDMKKLKQRKSDNDRKCSLERKHSLQEANQPRFFRNHGPSGRLSAPPGERFLIRPRAVHPMDRPLPAIPQKVEFSNYENHDEIQNYPRGISQNTRRQEVQNYTREPYSPENQDYENSSQFYENRNDFEKSELQRNHSIDSGFNLTPVAAQVKITRQLIITQNQKAPLVGRSPKYSPSSSQKSGDYADSSYTPNSSQKSEFSPSSSKSGEYYLHSPRTSAQTSPNDSLNDKREQIYENKPQSTKIPYPISPNVKIQNRTDPVYDETPISESSTRTPERVRSPELYEKSSPSPRSLKQRSSASPMHMHDANQESIYIQRSTSPNIPMSTNLAKLRANVENIPPRSPGCVPLRGESPTVATPTRSCEQKNSKQRLFDDNSKRNVAGIVSPVPTMARINSPVQSMESFSRTRALSPVQHQSQTSPRVVSPTRIQKTAVSPIQRIPSPLTIVPSNSPTPISNPMSPSGNQNRGSALPLVIPVSPTTGIPSPSPKVNQNRTLNEAQNRSACKMRTPVSSPNMNQNKTTPGTGAYLPMTSRRSQPNDQILIASPKRELTFESQNQRPSNTKGLECPKSPIPMADSPSQVLRTKVSLQQTVAERLGRCKSPKVDPDASKSPTVAIEPLYGSKPSLHRVSSTNIPTSPNSSQNASPNSIQRPEPIYGQRHPASQIYVQCQEGVQRTVSPTRRQETTILQNPEQTKSTSVQPHNAAKPEEMYGRSKISDIQRTVSPTRSLDAHGHSRSTSATPEQIYAERRVQPSPVQRSMSPSSNMQPGVYIQRQDGSLRSAVSRTQQPIYSSRPDSVTASQEQIYVMTQASHQEPLYGQRQQPGQDIYVQRTSEPIYGQNSNRQLSPAKRQTMQHLEAFYWQQKALEAQRKSMTSPSSLSQQDDPKIEPPEAREAMYWQQLKKLDEEQQKRIYEQNVADERGDPLYWRKKLQSPPTTPNTNVPRHSSNPNLINQTMSLPPNSEQLYWRSKLQQPKLNAAGKPPIMGQKGQNQPVLVVRPQPVYQEHDYQSQKIYSNQADIKQEPPRSKSVSPHFTRSDERRSLSLPRKYEPDEGGFLRGTRERSSIAALRKPETPPIYEEENETDKKPPPIFKRGSLISNSSNSVDYGTGTKRVSFSNQTNSPEVGAGIWPTKHGMAPEPPTRRHKFDRSSAHSDTDSVFLHDEENQNNSNTNVYGNVLARSVSQTGSPGAVSSKNMPMSKDNCNLPNTSKNSSKTNTSNSVEYDADRPLPPPPPREMSRFIRRSASMKDQARSGIGAKVDFNREKSAANPRKWPMASESESGSEAGEVQRILQRRSEEEWNPDGKGRQSNDTGGSGRGEGEGGSGDLPGGRRGGGGARVSGGGGGRSRDEPRRHTLSGDHQPSLHHQQFNAQQLHSLHPHHLPPPHGQYGTPPNRHTTMDLEMGTKSRQRKSPLPRGYPPPSSAMLFDDDPGIMSEVETSSTGFRRGGKQRSSLPVVRTPSKTLERPLGLVFLQYRNETKRALLPNEITSIDTVKALFVRSFPKQLTMEYLDSPLVKVYIHDSNKDMFYELEDMRSHLRDIRDRSVLRLFESTDGVAGMPGPLGAPGGGGGLPPHWEDQSYFSEPEFDSEFQHQHIHKSKTAKNSTSGSGGYYMGSSSTLPRGGPLLRAYSPAASSVVAGPNSTPTQPKTLNTPGGGGVAPVKPLRSYQCGKSPLGTLGGSARFSRDSSVSLYSIPDRLHGESGYMSSPERGGGVGSGTGRYPAAPYSTGSSYEDPYYSQYSGTVTPVIDEEASDTELLEESYSLYGVKPPGRPPSGPPRSPFPPGAPTLAPGGPPYDATRIRVEHMERQLANLTGLVQKALTHAPHPSPSPRDYLQVPAGRDPYRTAGAGDEFDKHSSSSSASLPDDSYLRTDVKPPKLGKDKSVSFEKSVSFSDEPPDMNSPKQHSPQHAADTKPTKPAIKSSTLPRMSSQERDRHKPAPPPKPATLAAGQYVYRDLALTPEMYNQLRGLQKKAKDLRQEVRNLRRMSQAQAHTVRETIRDTFITIRAMLLSGGDAAWAAGDTEKMRLSREEDLYKQEMIRLEKDLTELESTVEELRGNVINRKTRVNMSDVENMALILSKSSKTVADLKVRFPSLQEGMKGLLSSEMEKVVREEKFLKEEPERLESALRRCKKLTGTLVTLKRLASVQEQRLPNAASVESEETPPITPTSAQHSKTTAPVPAERTIVGSASVVGGGSHALDPSASHQQRPENALDALLDELQTFSRPASQLSQASSSISHAPNLSEFGRSASQLSQMSHAPSMSDIGRKGSVDSSTSLAIITPGHTSTLRRLHSYPSSSDTDTSPPIARLQVSDGSTPPQKPPVPERNAELLQLATARRVPPPPPPRTSSRSPLASPTSPQLPPRNPTGTLRRGRGNMKDSGKPPMALPPNANAADEQIPQNNILSASNSSSCESINSQEGLQNKKGRQEQLEQRHQELLRKQKALQEQYARLQQLQRNASGLTTVPPAPPDLLKKTGSESNLLAKMGLGLSTASSGSLTSLTSKLDPSIAPGANASGNQTTTNKIYETDIL